MKSLGGFLRYILNINTLWGLMVVVSLVVCVVKQYLPTGSTIPADCVREGTNILVIHIVGRDEKTQTFEYELSLASGNLVIPTEYRTPQRERPWLISVAPAEGSFRLKWDHADRGKYRVAMRRGQSSVNTIPLSVLADGDNTVSLRTIGAGDRRRTFEYGLSVKRAQGTVTFSDPQEHGAEPRLLSLDGTETGLLLRWDRPLDGGYELGVDKVVASGTLVTLQSMTDAAFDYAKTGFDLALGLVASMVLFLGLMKVGENAGIVQLAARAFHPVLRFVFPQVPKDHPANGAILMNVTTSILGLGNAATPFGLKAMKELQSLNPHPDVATDSQVMLLAYNTAGLALLPTTLLAVRKAAGCNDPFEIIGTCIIGGAVSVLVAIVASRLLARVPFFSVKAALQERAEGAAEQGSQG